jgi:hypothetical protein
MKIKITHDSLPTILYDLKGKVGLILFQKVRSLPKPEWMTDMEDPDKLPKWTP